MNILNTYRSLYLYSRLSSLQQIIQLNIYLYVQLPKIAWNDQQVSVTKPHTRTFLIFFNVNNYQIQTLVTMPAFNTIWSIQHDITRLSFASYRHKLTLYFSVSLWPIFYLRNLYCIFWLMSPWMYRWNSLPQSQMYIAVHTCSRTSTL